MGASIDRKSPVGAVRKSPVGADLGKSPVGAEFRKSPVGADVFGKSPVGACDNFENRQWAHDSSSESRQVAQVISIVNGRRQVVKGHGYHEDFLMHMQRCFLGIVLQKIFLVQDFIKIYRDNQIKEGNTRLDLASMVKLNNILRPWYHVLILILNHKQCKRISNLNGGNMSCISTDLDKKDIVYARINIECNAMYIGRTGNFAERCKAHFSATWKHNNDCDDKCKGCATGDFDGEVGGVGRHGDYLRSIPGILLCERCCVAKMGSMLPHF